MLCFAMLKANESLRLFTYLLTDYLVIICSFMLILSSGISEQLVITAHMASVPKKTTLKPFIDFKFSKPVDLVDPNPPFPFDFGQQFTMNITMLDPNTMEVSNFRIIISMDK